MMMTCLLIVTKFLLFSYMGKQQFLVVFGGILFGLAASFYLNSYVRLIRKKSLYKEIKYLIYSFGFFLTTLIVWYLTYDMVPYVDDSIVYFLLAFCEIGLLFIISGLMNPDSNQDPSWQYLQERLGNIMVLCSLTAVWGLLVPIIFTGVTLLVHPMVSVGMVTFTVVYRFFNRPIVSHLFIAYIYALNIYLIIVSS